MQNKLFALATLVLISLSLVLIWWFTRPHPHGVPAAQPIWWEFTQPAAKGQSASPQLENGLCSWLGQAKLSLDLAVFELDLPCVVEQLTQAQQRGVKVRLVFDDENKGPEITALQAAGIPIVFDQRSAFMHNKFIVRDQQAVWTGSFNLTRNASERQNNNALTLSSPELARRYQSEFEEMFLQQSFGPKSHQQAGPVLFRLSPELQVEALFAPEDPVQSRLLDLLRHAKQRIWFLAFSYTDDQLGALMRERAKAGVQVRGVFEKTGARTRFSEYTALKKAGLDVKLDGNPGIMHHKVMIIDEQIVVTGSYNFSGNAAQSNDENLVVLHHQPANQAFAEEFERVYSLAR